MDVSTVSVPTSRRGVEGGQVLALVIACERSGKPAFVSVNRGTGDKISSAAPMLVVESRDFFPTWSSADRSLPRKMWFRLDGLQPVRLKTLGRLAGTLKGNFVRELRQKRAMRSR
jgi:hypothetical protein